MRWIKDVRLQLQELDVGMHRLRQFGLLLTLFLILLSILAKQGGRLQPWFPQLVVLAVLCLAVSLVQPTLFRGLYRSWMALAFAVGWWISRIVLLCVFYLVLTPVGVLARLRGKPFLDVRFPDPAPSFWRPRRSENRRSYHRMF